MQKSKLFLILAGFASATAFAQSSPADMQTGTGDSVSSTVARLEKQSESGMKYVCGGIGSGEATSLKKAASDYDLMMTFAASTGAYIADVDVEIMDPQGRSLMNVACGGPIMLVDLPRDGRYRVHADAEGKTLIRSAEVSKGGSVERIYLAWPVQTVDMGLSPSARPEQSGASMSGSGSGGAAASGSGTEAR